MRSEITLVVTADAGKLVLELVGNLVECYDGVLLGRVGRAQVDGFSCGLDDAISCDSGTGSYTNIPFRLG